MTVKTIYMEQTMILLTNSMKFKTEELLDSFLDNTFIEKETTTGIIYYIQKDLNPSN